MILNNAKNLALFAATIYGTYRVVADKLFDTTFKKNDQDFNLESQYIDWLKNSRGLNVNIKSYDGLNLHGLKIENHQTDNYIIIVHGIWSNMKWMIPWAYEFDKLGYNLLLVDQRASGSSEGNYYTYGLKESFDLINWTNYLINQNKNIKIVYFGVSMGAATIMQSTRNILPNNVKCLIEDCGYASLKEELAYVLKNKYKISKPYPVLNIFESKMYERLGFKFADIEPSTALKNNDKPLLIIHGEQDHLVPFTMSKIIYNSQRGYKKFYPVKDAHHAKAMSDKNYFVYIDEFIKKFVE